MNINKILILLSPFFLFIPSTVLSFEVINEAHKEALKNCEYQPKILANINFLEYILLDRKSLPANPTYEKLTEKQVRKIENLAASQAPGSIINLRRKVDKLLRDCMAKEMKISPDKINLLPMLVFSHASLRANKKSQSKDFYGAIFECTEGIKLNPSDDTCYLERGNSKYLLNDFKGSIADLTKAIKINRYNYFAYFLRGQSNNQLGNKGEACEDYRRSSILGFQPATESLQKLSDCR